MTFPTRNLLVALSGLALTVAVGAQALPSKVEVESPTPTQKADCQPLYPEAALRAGVQGVTLLSFHVDETGRITSGKVVRSSGPTREHRMLDGAALHALMLCPVKAQVDENGHPVASDVEVPYTWRLQ